MEVPFLVVTLGSKVLEKRRLDQEVISIGRAQENDIIINNLSVSRYHAIVYNKGGKVVVKDLGSANGTFVNGKKVDETDLWIGDVVLIGKHVIKFSRGEDSRSEEDLAFQGEGGTVMVDARSREKLLEKLRGNSFKIPKLILSDGKEVQVGDDFFTIGKGEGSNLKIDGIFVKSPHTRIIRQADGTYKIISTDSFLKPTKVNGARVKEKVLRDGDIIQIGKYEMVFSL